ncbi:MAG TPA: ABC transporter permease [Thermoanaerobaculia bacterium]|nr:ABC transporter permease [Thermoanaerobaculia bacterium]
MKVKSEGRRAGNSLYLLSELVVRDLRSRYVGSFLGPVWALLAPLAWVVIYTFVFSVVLKIPLSGEPAGVVFPEYLLAGFIPWLAVQEGLMRSSTCLTDNSAMVKKAVFPKQTLVATVVLSAVVNELIGLFLYSAYLAWRGHFSPRWAALVVPLLAAQILATYGIGCLLAGLQVFLRDTAQVAGLALAMVGFLTPIFYPVSFVPVRFRWVVSANPVAHLIEGFRDALFRHTLPGAGSAAFLLVFSAAAAMLGSLLFVKAEPHFADLL